MEDSELGGFQAGEGEGELYLPPEGGHGSDEPPSPDLAELVPWRGSRTPQERGREAERRLVKERGGRVHPRSGAGRIKNDGSTKESDFEVKHTGRSSFTLKGADLRKSWVDSVRAGKEEMRWVIEFANYDIVAEITVKPKGIITDE